MVRKTIGLDTKIVLVLLLLLVTAAGIVYVNTSVRTPDGFNKVLVYMAAGQYDPNMPPPDGDIVMWFHKEIIGRSYDEILAEKAAAEAYFKNQFGPGPPEPIAFDVDQRNEYRVYFISGMDAPSEGWVVRDVDSWL